MSSNKTSISGKANHPASHSRLHLLMVGTLLLTVTLGLIAFSMSRAVEKTDDPPAVQSATIPVEKVVVAKTTTAPVNVLPVQKKDQQSEDRKAVKEKPLTERERRLQSLAKSVEKEERPALPSFAGVRSGKRPGGAITFDDIKFEMGQGEKFSRSMLTDSINELVGQRLRVKGYIRPSIRQKDLTKFIFVRDDKECCFGPGAAIFDCILVTLVDGQTIDFTVRPLTIEGDFILKEFVGPDRRVWAVYRMKNSKVKK